MSFFVLLRRFLLVFAAASAIVCLLLRWLPPPTTGFMLFRHAEDLFSGRGYQPINHRWASGDTIAEAAFVAVVAAEDQHFYEHHGFDYPAIYASIVDYLNGKRLRGASTLSQQVAKNLFLSPSKNLIRKGLEVWFTACIEMFWSKRRILEVYLNIAEFGDHLFGIEAASRRYFGISAKRLSRSQAALLAATLPNPIRLSAAKPSNYVLKRQRWILGQMRNLGGAPGD